MKEGSILIEVPEPTVRNWQNIIDILSRLTNVPAALIMRVVDEDIEVFLSSNSEGNPYHPGDREHLWGSGLYCETVIKTNEKLLVQNALTDKDWDKNPDIKLNMISYLGYPINLPNGIPFGTLCVLDNKENAYSITTKQLILNFKELIEGHLGLLHMNQILGDKNKSLNDYLSEIKTLRSILPLCSFCKKIRDDKGYWEQVDVYIHKHLQADISHSVCPECAKEHYPDLDIYDD